MSLRTQALVGSCGTVDLPKTKTFSLYLVKSQVTVFEEVLTQTARERINAGQTILGQSDHLGNSARVFIFQNESKPPSWMSDLKSVFEGLPTVLNKSSCAIIVFKQSERVFVAPFAHGWQYIDDTKIETDFGLRVAINSLDDTKLKRVDSSHLGEAMKGVSQSAFQRDLQAFGIDEALDLVRRITGRAEGDDFAANLAGSTSLKITREMVLSDLAEIAAEALSRFESQSYKKTGFHIIDKVRPILDRARRAQLDAEAVAKIKSGEDTFELSMPGWSEEDVVYYGMVGPGLRGRFADLLMENYRNALGADIADLDVDAITRKHGVFAEFSNDAAARKKWSIKKALIGSVVVEGGLYAISEGEWYRLDEAFKDDVDASFRDLIQPWEEEPERIIKKISEDGNKTGFERELDYNNRCATSYNQICLDQKTLTVPAIPYGRFEACDLLDVERRKLIHVKKSSRQSSVLSHFFKQGSNSARILKTFPEARNVLIQKVRDLASNDAAEALNDSLSASIEDWSVEFHIIDAPRRDGSFAIPFFSRITLRDECRILKGMDFGVALKFISTAPAPA